MPERPLADFSHQTVLLKEAVDVLRPGAGTVIVDGTLGGGGHTRGAAAPGVRRSSAWTATRVALAGRARARLAGFPRFSARQGNFGDLLELASDVLPVDGVLVDLGVSSPQLDVAERGFSFQSDGPLDMRMGDSGPHRRRAHRGRGRGGARAASSASTARSPSPGASPASSSAPRPRAPWRRPRSSSARCRAGLAQEDPRGHQAPSRRCAWR